jgi:hypothetical protein
MVCFTRGRTRIVSRVRSLTAACALRRVGALALGVAAVVACQAPPSEEEPLESATSDVLAPVWNTGNMSLNVRRRPTTASEIITTIPPGTTVDIACQTEGEVIDGTPVWDWLPAYGGYVSDARLYTGYDGFAPNIPRCSTTSPSSSSSSSGGAGGGVGGGAPITRGFLLPLECGTSAMVTQGRGGYSHWNEAYYGTDFGVPLNTPLVATDDGRVRLVKNDVRPGDPCYSGGGPACANTVNYVVIAHADGTDTAYLHVNTVLVRVGEVVRRGQRVALSGGTGWSTGPHAHVQRQQRCGSWWCWSIPVTYGDVGSDTYTGQWVTSSNCPGR